VLHPADGHARSYEPSFKGRENCPMNQFSVGRSALSTTRMSTGAFRDSSFNPIRSIAVKKDGSPSGLASPEASVLKLSRDHSSENV
jgi:hypothetical protein